MPILDVKMPDTKFVILDADSRVQIVDWSECEIPVLFCQECSSQVAG